MARVTADEVKAIIQTNVTDTQMQEYIFSAEVLLSSAFANRGLADDIYKEVTRWVTAHLIASSRDRQAREEGAGGAYVKYTGLSYTGLRGTTYGQHAITLDPTGVLAMMAGKVVHFKAIPEK